MPARDIYHHQAKNALGKDGWTITDDPLRLRYRSVDTYVDLGAEKLLAAEKDNQKIAIEVKSFIRPSMVSDLEDAIGQFVLYEELLRLIEPDRILFLAVTNEAYENAFLDALGEIFINSKRVRLLVFDPQAEVVVKWIA